MTPEQLETDYKVRKDQLNAIVDLVGMPITLQLLADRMLTMSEAEGTTEELAHYMQSIALND